MKATVKPLCIIVVPCFNERSRLRVAHFLDFVRNVDGVRFLFVNDGSRDDTVAVLETIKAGSPDRIQILDNKENRGKAEAVRLGMLRALQDGNIDYVGFWDADLSTPLDVIPDFVAHMNGDNCLQMVFGSRVRLLGREVDRRAVRHYLGRVFASFASITLRLPIYDTQCGAKIFRVTPELALALTEPFMSKWIFDVEILARYITLHRGDSSYLRRSIYELPLPRWAEVAGSKVRLGDFFTAAKDLYRIHHKYLAGWERSKRAISQRVLGAKVEDFRP